MLCFGLSPAMAASHEEGEHHGPPPPPPEMVEILEDLLEEGQLSEATANMIEHLLMTPEEREEAGEPDISDQEEELVKEEITAIFDALLEDDIPEPAANFINIIQGHMDGGPMGPPPGDGDGADAAHQAVDEERDRAHQAAEAAADAAHQAADAAADAAHQAIEAGND